MIKKPFIFAFFILFTFLNFNAFSNDSLVIKNVKVAVIDKNATVARNLAIEKAQIRAFQELIKRYYPNSLNKITNLSNEQIISAVDSFELSNEKRSASEYHAKVNVKFNKDLVEKLIGGAKNSTPLKDKKSFELPSEKPAEELDLNDNLKTVQPSMDTLIMLILEKDGKIYWFDEHNKWLEFWNKKLSKEAINKFTLPAEDLEDMALLNKNIFSKNIIDLAPLFERYTINNIAIAKLKAFEFEEKEHYQLQIYYINRYSHTWQNSSFAEENLSNINQIMEAYYQKIQNFEFQVVENFAESLKTSAPQTIEVMYPIKDLSEWNKLQEVFKNIKYITAIDLSNISADVYRFNLTSVVSLTELDKLLKNYNFTLNKEDKIYLLTRRLNNDSEQ